MKAELQEMKTRQDEQEVNAILSKGNLQPANITPGDSVADTQPKIVLEKPSVDSSSLNSTDVATVSPGDESSYSASQGGTLRLLGIVIGVALVVLIAAGFLLRRPQAT